MPNKYVHFHKYTISYFVNISIISFFLLGIWAIDSMMLQAVWRADRDDNENMACCSQVVWVNFMCMAGVLLIFCLHFPTYFSIK
jgi:hypothetical protein